MALHETCEANHTQSLELLQNIKAMLQRVLAVRDGTKMPVEGNAEGHQLLIRIGELRHQHEVYERRIAELEAALVHLCHTCPETFDRGLQGLQQLVEDGLRVTSETEARLVDFRRRVVALLTGAQANLDRREVEKGT